MRGNRSFAPLSRRVCLPVWAADKTSIRTKSSRNLPPRKPEFREARNNYTYRQSVKMEDWTERQSDGGKWEEVEDIIFTPEGKRMEKVVYAPVITLQQIIADARRSCRICATCSRSC